MTNYYHDIGRRVLFVFIVLPIISCDSRNTVHRPTGLLVPSNSKIVNELWSNEDPDAVYYAKVEINREDFIEYARKVGITEYHVTSRDQSGQKIPFTMYANLPWWDVPRGDEDMPQISQLVESRYYFRDVSDNWVFYQYWDGYVYIVYIFD